jgi:Putative auto-transporter adhesin, head GIN domain
MKRLFTIFTILITSVVIAQNPIEKNIGDFKELKVYDLIEVELIKSDSNKIIITGGNAESVLVNNKNGVLKIKMELSKIFDGNFTKVKLYYTTIDVIDANEGSKIHSKDNFKQFEMDLKAQEGANIDVIVDVNYVNAKAVTGGIIKVTGVAKKGNVTLLTGGIFHGEALKAENSDVSINAAGEAYVNASKVLDIKIRAGGDVFIYGKPETVNESKVFGGRVKRMD